MNHRSAIKILNNEEVLDIGQMAEAAMVEKVREEKARKKRTRKKHGGGNMESWLRHQATEENREKLRQEIIKILKKIYP